MSPHLRRVKFLWLLLQILNYYHPIWGKLNFYGFYYKFSIIIIPPEVDRIFMTFIIDSQLLSSWLRQVAFLWLSLQILNYYYLVWSKRDFYGFYYTFLIIIIPPEAGWLFMVFITDFQLLSSCLRHIQFL